MAPQVAGEHRRPEQYSDLLPQSGPAILGVKLCFTAFPAMAAVLKLVSSSTIKAGLLGRHPQAGVADRTSVESYLYLRHQLRAVASGLKQCSIHSAVRTDSAPYAVSFRGKERCMEPLQREDNTGLAPFSCLLHKIEKAGKTPPWSF